MTSTDPRCRNPPRHLCTCFFVHNWTGHESEATARGGGATLCQLEREGEPFSVEHESAALTRRRKEIERRDRGLPIFVAT